MIDALSNFYHSDDYHIYGAAFAYCFALCEFITGSLEGYADNQRLRVSVPGMAWAIFGTWQLLQIH